VFGQHAGKRCLPALAGAQQSRDRVNAKCIPDPREEFWSINHATRVFRENPHVNRGFSWYLGLLR
jgi:hypothetical protein